MAFEEFLGEFHAGDEIFRIAALSQACQEGKHPVPVESIRGDVVRPFQDSTDFRRAGLPADAGFEEQLCKGGPPLFGLFYNQIPPVQGVGRWRMGQKPAHAPAKGGILLELQRPVEC